jgi:hypothetical protein
MAKGGRMDSRAWGQSAHLRVLQQEARKKLNDLAARLRSAESPELKAQIKAEIEATKADFAAKQRSAQRSLFSRA